MGLLNLWFRYLSKELFNQSVTIVALCCILTALILPLFLPRFFIKIFTVTFIYVILASGWNIASGYAGQNNLGIAFLFGAGGYASAIVNAKFGLPVWASIVIGTLTATILGIVPGLISLRLSRSYLGLATLTLPIILSTIILYAFPSELAGGEFGLLISPLMKDPILEYYIILLVLLFFLTIVWKIASSKIGLIFQVIRENEHVAQASGINTYFYKIFAFLLCGFLAGLSGSLYAHCIQVIGPSILSFSMSFYPIIWCLMGGVSTVYGPLVGALFLHIPTSLLRGYIGTYVEYMPYVLLILVAFARGGVGRWIVQKLKK